MAMALTRNGLADWASGPTNGRSQQIGWKVGTYSLAVAVLALAVSLLPPTVSDAHLAPGARMTVPGLADGLPGPAAREESEYRTWLHHAHADAARHGADELPMSTF